MTFIALALDRVVEAPSWKVPVVAATAAPTKEFAVMTLFDHLVVLIEPVTGDDAIVDLARQAAADGGRVTVLLRPTPRFEADVAGFARSEELDLDVANDLAIERVVERYRSLIGSGAAVVVAGDSGLPLEHPSLVGASALAVPASAMYEPALRAQLSRSPLPVVVAPGVDRARVPAGVA